MYQINPEHEYYRTPAGKRVRLFDIDYCWEHCLVRSDFDVRPWWIDAELLVPISREEFYRCEVLRT